MADPTTTEMAAPGSRRPRSWAMKAAGLLGLAGAAIVVYWLFAAGQRPDETGFQRFATGTLKQLVVMETPPPLPSTPLITADGSATALTAMKGEVLVVNLWATWCAPCVEEMPTLARLQANFEGKGVRVAPISVDRPADKAFAVETLRELSGGKLAFLGDPTYASAYATKARGFPTTIVYAKDGRELARLSGIADWSAPEAKALIEAALAE